MSTLTFDSFLGCMGETFSETSTMTRVIDRVNIHTLMGMNTYLRTYCVKGHSTWCGSALLGYSQPSSLLIVWPNQQT